MGPRIQSWPCGGVHVNVFIVVTTVILVLLALVPALQAFGFDLRIFRRAPLPPEAIGFKRNFSWRRWVPLTLAMVSLGFSVFAVYYFSRPRIIEKTVEKIVEKPVASPCPPQTSNPVVGPTLGTAPLKGREHIKGNTITAHKSPSPFTQNCPNGICNAGNNLGSQTVNNFTPPRRHLTDQQIEQLGDAAVEVPLSQKLTVMSSNDPDSIEYSGEIYRAIEKKAKSILTPGPEIALAGFSGGREGEREPEGVVVCILDETDATFRYAQQLATALNSTLAPVNFTKCTGLKSGMIKIIVAQP